MLSRAHIQMVEARGNVCPRNRFWKSREGPSVFKTFLCIWKKQVFKIKMVTLFESNRKKEK